VRIFLGCEPAGTGGLEPPTFSLTGRRTTIVLHARGPSQNRTEEGRFAGGSLTTWGRDHGDTRGFLRVAPVKVERIALSILSVPSRAGSYYPTPRGLRELPRRVKGEVGYSQDLYPAIQIRLSGFSVRTFASVLYLLHGLSPKSFGASSSYQKFGQRP
jgi:hypothetical protein